MQFENDVGVWQPEMSDVLELRLIGLRRNSTPQTNYLKWLNSTTWFFYRQLGAVN
jgi:hypothetical protein